MMTAKQIGQFVCLSLQQNRAKLTQQSAQARPFSVLLCIEAEANEPFHRIKRGERTMSLPQFDTDTSARLIMATEGCSSGDRRGMYVPISNFLQKAPFQQVLDEMNNRPITPDIQIIMENYPKLMKYYEDDLESVYETAEESCCRIIAGTELPDLLPTLGNYPNTDHCAKTAKRCFYEA
eukprot:IDg16486t1